MERSLIVVKKVLGKFNYYLKSVEYSGYNYEFEWNGLKNNAESFPSEAGNKYLNILRRTNPDDEYYTIPS